MSTNIVISTNNFVPIVLTEAFEASPCKVSEVVHNQLVENRVETPTQQFTAKLALKTLEILEVGEGVSREMTSYDSLLKAILFESEEEALKLLHTMDLTECSILSKKDKSGTTLLHWAVKKGKLELSSKLLNILGVKGDAQDDQGMTPLHLAARRGYTGLVQQMISKGCCVDVKDQEGRTPLYNACWGAQEATAYALYKAGANPLLTFTAKNITIVEIAIEEGLLKFAALLVKDASDSDLEKITGRTRLMWAALTNDLDLVREVLKETGDINAQDQDGQTALHLAIDNLYFDIILELLDRDAKMNLADCDKETALILLSNYGLKLPEKIQRRLLEKGINIADIAKLDRIYNVWAIDKPTKYKDHILGGGLSDDAFFSFYPSYVSEYFQRAAHPLFKVINTTQLSDAFLAMEENRNADPEELLQRVKEGRYVVFGTGWQGHFIGAVFKQDSDGTFFLGKSNRGDASGDTGAEIFKIFKAENLKAAMKELSHANLTEGPKYYNEDLENELGALRTRLLPMPEQESSNCPIASTEGMILNVLYWEFRKSLPHDKALANAQDILNDFIAYARERSIVEYVNTTKEPDLDLLVELLDRAKHDPIMQKRLPSIRKRIDAIKLPVAIPVPKTFKALKPKRSFFGCFQAASA